MATKTIEDLDERIERIKKRNEEIEKKYREAEEDKLRALKENAMVETKPPKDEDWPKAHKYDKVDFTYDVKPEKLEDVKLRKPEDVKPKRDYKKFADGEGPPPDPAYNFLADAERDGDLSSKNENKGDKKDPRQNKNKDPKRNSSGNNSFRGKSGKPNNPKYQKQNSQPEYDQWRSEREKIDEARINRQKVGDGKWRREWDNDKLIGENEALLRPERTTLGDAINAVPKKSPSHIKNNVQHSGQSLNNPDCLIEKRGNITVSVSQTGEVKSVKLTSAPPIGTGRVGPRQVSKPQFCVQAVEKELNVQQVPLSPRLQKKNYKTSYNNQTAQHKPSAQNFFNKTTGQNSNINPKPYIKGTNHVAANQRTPGALHNSTAHPPSPIKNKRKPPNPKYVPPQYGGVPEVPLIVDPAVVDGIVPMDLSHKPEFARKSVQERLLRAKMDVDVEKEETVQVVDTTCDKSNESIQPIAACN